MAKFNLFAYESTVAERPSFEKAGAALAIPASQFAGALGLWFVLMFVLGCLILAA